VKDEFLAVVSHELRAPLTSIMGWAHILASRKPDAETLARGVQTIERNARLQAKLIDDILDFARINAGKLRLETAPMALEPIVRSAVEGIAPAAAAKSIAVDMELDPGTGTIRGDADRLQQVLWNILNNAVKFTPEHGRVAVRLRALAADLEIRVSDTGKGSAAEFMPYVFERFRQGEGEGPRREGGVGLGMAIARHIVEMHGGAIGAESAGPGQGTTFTVRLPRTGA
jgi:signal transduction histidine kinase